MKKLFLILILCLHCTTIYPIEVIKDIFWNNGPLVLDDQGNMYVGYDIHSIVKYSPKGEMLLKMGQDGSGPGDLKRMTWHALNPKDHFIYVTEYYEGNRWVSRFTTDGKFVGAWNHKLDWSQYDVVSIIDFDSQGNVLLKAGKSNVKQYKDFRLNNMKEDLLKLSPDGELLATIYKFNSESAAYKDGNFTATIPFKNNISWVIYGDKIIVKETSGNFINIFSPDGKLEKKIPFPVKSEKVTEADIDDWEKEVNSWGWLKKATAEGRANVKYWRKRLPFPEYKPNSNWRMFTDLKGNLYISEYKGYRKKDTAWFRINLQDGKTDRLTFKTGENLSLTWKNYFIFSKTNEDEEEQTETITKIEEKELLTWCAQNG